MDSKNDREEFARDVEARTERNAREWLNRPGVKEKLAAYDHLVQPCDEPRKVA